MRANPNQSMEEYRESLMSGSNRLPASGVTDVVKILNADDEFIWVRYEEDGGEIRSSKFATRELAINNALRVNGGNYRIEQ